ncbi:hypothetical protein J2X20_002187 [Pelomonas saccharophila]|uniref:Uncharacterized protein n=1 Tax=Roseateles saccharophilus TaxID=304 RepID=A0ABU1YL21_ROSSA|nr:hypothetical protein [Roseateles saccharophilus]
MKAFAVDRHRQKRYGLLHILAGHPHAGAPG